VLGTEKQWQGFRTCLPPAYADALLLDESNWKDDGTFGNMKVVLSEGACFAWVCPRGVGPTQSAANGSREELQIRRRFPLIGQTLEGQQVWDVRRAVQTLRSVEELEKIPLTLNGTDTSAGLALYAALFEPSVRQVELSEVPTSHKEGPMLLK